MIVNGIIAEYNPLHQGHIYQMTDARNATEADYTVVVMSGDYVQRGAPALLDKYTRTQMALESGADLVLELPLPYSLSSAEFFALGGVCLLDRLGVVSHLCFGSEAGVVTPLMEIAKELHLESPTFKMALQSALREGLTYPQARTRALQESSTSEIQQELLASPNNILGIEYCKALLRLNSSIVPYTTKRLGAGYQDANLQEISSALSIRQALMQGTQPEKLKKHLPPCTYTELKNAHKIGQLLSTRDFSTVLLYRLLSEQRQGYSDYLDVSEDLSKRITNQLENFRDFDSFCELLKTKELTYTRVSRCLMHILLDIRKDTLEIYKAQGTIPYARILGFRQESAPLLSAIKKHSDLPLISKLADAPNLLSAENFALLSKELTANQIYYGIQAQKSGQVMMNEYRRPMIVL